jgi:hypothetical protein
MPTEILAFEIHVRISRGGKQIMFSNKKAGPAVALPLNIFYYYAAASYSTG